MKEKLLISACLCGKNTKYNGKNNLLLKLSDLEKSFDLHLICPEVMGGLPIPRDPSEIKGDFVFSSQGKDVTKEYQLGAQRALRIALKNDIRIALLKESSPSCGSFQVYNGEFTHEKIPGEGMTTKLLRKHNILVFNENQITDLLNFIK
ncbi:MAG: DUF523 domain-containing protein [Acholeplasmatales bacterium]|jgi:uncharacterized protein YbbK (DUF523 family)|uniref:DUF523 domain-containing protein n=1 Tax=Thomasclavelia cocleata TaxID=69824 RepID=UPI00258EF918|nr:DUF523 domain-containing protein [Thomasclavelia cocleata]MCI9182783.1 DUF523 domain-containing protein [Acholeplasmatales bacterium]